jgi:hypothetical protein
MSRHNFGTAIRRDINAQMLGKALAAPGMDQRYWCSLGTVCTVDPETGKMDPADKLAIYNDSAGVDVDVELEPLGQPCTCKYAGVQCGDVTIMAPIRPGDIVLVECPDGDLFTPVITHIMQSRSKRQPTEGGKPIFDNARLLIHARTVPIDIRTAGGAQVLLGQDGAIEAKNDAGADVKLGADGSISATTKKSSVVLDTAGNAQISAEAFVKLGAVATEANMLGTTFDVAWQAILLTLGNYVDGIKDNVEDSPYPLTTALKAAIQGAQLAPILSTKVLTE